MVVTTKSSFAGRDLMRDMDMGRRLRLHASSCSTDNFKKMKS